MLSRNRILQIFFLLSLISWDFWSLFCSFSLFCCLWICVLDCTLFVTVTCWAVNLLLHCFHPILHSIYALTCNSVLPDSKAQQTWLCTWQRPWEGLGLPLQRVAFMCKAHTSHCQMTLANPFLPAACRAGRGELQRNPRKMWRPEYSSFRTHFSTALWPYF